MADIQTALQGVWGRQANFLEVPGTDSASGLPVVSFDATEKMGQPNEVSIVLTHPLRLPHTDYLNRDATFSIMPDDGVPRKFSRYIERFLTIQTTKGFVRYQLVLKSHFGRLQGVMNTQTFQHLTTPQIFQKILRRQGRTFELGRTLNDALMAFFLRTRNSYLPQGQSTVQLNVEVANVEREQDMRISHQSRTAMSL
jgi:uncharacterized protein involved in type VI secretion and phage assembly